MSLEKLLIFDLDDTIFETRSMGTDHLDKIFKEFRKSASVHYSQATIDRIEHDLWQLPFDQVAMQYEFSPSLCDQFSKLINATHYRLNIRPFPDFEYIRECDFRKVLVTTGFKKLQEAKIAALQLTPDFETIYIDEIDVPNRTFKSGIFTGILSESGLNKKSHIVIGDNPESELKAGHELGFTTIQVAKFGQKRSPYSHFYITDYQELFSLLNG